MMRFIGHPAQFLLLAPWYAVAEVTFTSLPIDVLVRNHLVNDRTVLVRNVMSSSDRPCVALFEKYGTTTNEDEFLLPDWGIALGTGGDPFSGTMALVRREDTGEYYPEPSSGSQRLSDGVVRGSFDTCRFRFEFQCDVGSRVEFGYTFASEEYGTASNNDNTFEVLLNSQNVALIPGDDDWRWDSAPVTVADAWVVPGWNEIEFVIGGGGDDGDNSWAFLEAGSFSCVPSITLYDGDEANTSADDEADTVQGLSMMPLLVAVVVTILLVMIAMGLALISRMVVAAQVTPVDASPVAENKAAAADNESQSRRITSVTIVSPVTTAWYYPWYYPYTWYNNYNYR